MKKKLTLAVIALSSTSLALAQNDSIGQMGAIMGEQAFTFTEAQLGEEDNFSQNVTIINSNSNIYASQVGYLFSPVRFRYRAFNQKYNDVYINGAPMNDMETGQFRYSLVGGLNQQTRNMDSAMPFEENAFNMSNMAGSNNYDFRPANMAVGQRISLAGANRNYTVRGMYTYNSGLNSKGWAVSANVTYRWADKGYVEGTFYNALSYYLGVQKLFGENNKHSLTFATWGNPTERASQGASTDEMYWIANDNTYNPYWGYQNGKKRNSRIVNDFAPTALLTWDWKINDDMKVTTTLAGKYGWYSSTKLNYNNSDNPHPDYWKMLPSSYYDVWGDNTQFQTDQALEDWKLAYEYLSSSKANRQINWDRLYLSNKNASAQGADAMYYIQKRHNDQSMITLSSTLNAHLDKKSKWNIGYLLSTSNTKHYQTMDDLLGATTFHNINTYAIGTYAPGSNEVQYDLNNPNRVVGEGDKFGYDYDIRVNKGSVWTSYTRNMRRFNVLVAGRIGATSMERNGKMRNGLFPNNSYGKSGMANFCEGGAKAAMTFSAGHGHTFSLGVGYQWNAPTASTAFQAAEMNNDFVKNLKNERVFSSEFGYQYQGDNWHAGANFYYMDYDNQLAQTGQLSDIGEALTTNIKDSYRMGVELTAGWAPLSWLSVEGNAALSKNKIKDFDEFVSNWEDDKKPGVVHYDNSTLSYSPSAILNGFIDLHYAGFSATWHTNFVSRQYITNTEDRDFSLPCYSQSDLSLNYSTKVTKVLGIKEVSFGVDINNIFNRHYAASAFTWANAIGYGYTLDNRFKQIAYIPMADTTWMTHLTLKF